jgi:hypothetical protein
MFGVSECISMSQQGIRTFFWTVVHIFVRMKVRSDVNWKRAQIDATFSNLHRCEDYHNPWQCVLFLYKLSKTTFPSLRLWSRRQGPQKHRYSSHSHTERCPDASTVNTENRDPQISNKSYRHCWYLYHLQNVPISIYTSAQSFLQTIPTSILGKR